MDIIQVSGTEFLTYIANGQLAQGSVGQDNTVIDTSSFCLRGQYKLKTLYDQEHGFYYIYTMHVGVYLILIATSHLLIANGVEIRETEKQGLFQAPEVVCTTSWP